jgi:hypothetical protein
MMTEREYRAHLGQGSHDLMRALRTHHEWAHPPDLDTPDIRVGSAAHCLLLEPEHFGARYVQAPEPPDTCASSATDARKVLSEAGIKVKSAALASEVWEAFRDAGYMTTQEWLASWYDQHPGVTTLSGAEHDRALGINAAVRRHRRAIALINDAAGLEVPHVWEAAGVQCKRKRDVCGGTLGGWFADLKTTVDPIEWGNKLRWNTATTLLQMAHYGGLTDKCLIICAGSVAPFDVVVYEVDRDLIERGEEKRITALLRVREWQAMAEQAAFSGEPADYSEQRIIPITAGGPQW